MKIGIVAPLWLHMPTYKYGGTEQIVTTLTEGLLQQGHSVTLFAPEATHTNAPVHSTMEKSLLQSGINWEDPRAIDLHIHHYLEAFSHAKNFDLLHIHLNMQHDHVALLLAERSPVPVVFTLHYPAPTPEFRPESYQVLNAFRHLPFISISNAARSGNSWNFVRTVYNAIDIQHLNFHSDSEEYFAWIGKALPIKGLKETIHVAKKASVQLKIMAAIDQQKPESVAYFEQEVRPLIDGKQIVFLGEADVKMKNDVLGRAKAFLNPLQWPEPFGMVMAESQALGTPVIALDNGATRELVVEGKTGFIVKNLVEMQRRMDQIDWIDRKECRKYVEANFTPERMIAGYIEAYETVIANWAKIT